MRAALRDDVPDRSLPPVPTTTVRLDGERPVPPDVDVEVQPSLTIRRRVKTGENDDGDPTFDWVEVVSGVAILWEERDEYDADAGITYVRARAVILYDGDVEVTETALVESTHGGVFGVVSVAQTPDRVEMSLERIDDAG